MIEILKTYVGSRAHGTEWSGSDYDERIVFVLPTSQIVGLGEHAKFIEDKTIDSNKWELAHFLYLGLRCNPTILEFLLTTPFETHPWGEELLSLYPCFIRKKYVYDAFRGFAEGQRKKMMSPDTNSQRKPKSASNYLRVLYNGLELLTSGTMTIRIIDTEIGELVRRAKFGEASFEEVFAAGTKLLERLDRAYETSVLPEEPDRDTINEFLLRVRKEYW